MELRNINTFLHIAELHSFSRTARQLGYSQSAVSSQIAQLEAELGAPLFDRVGKTVRLTGAGETFLGYARTLQGGCASRWPTRCAAPFCPTCSSGTTRSTRRWNWCSAPPLTTACCRC